MFKFTQNLGKPKMNQDAFPSSVKIKLNVQEIDLLASEGF